MKTILMSFVLLILFACKDKSKQADNSNILPESTLDEKAIKDFEYHFKILDSVQAAKPEDSIFVCCSPSIKFMEISTGISTSEEGSVLGKLSFSNNDLQNWHGWYAEHFKGK